MQLLPVRRQDAGGASRLPAAQGGRHPHAVAAVSRRTGQAERIVKEYIAGDTVFDYVRRNEMQPAFFSQIREMCAQLYPAGLNIDYFPTNFVVRDGLLYYIDFECNGYQVQWDFEHWGIKYWSRTLEFQEYLRSHGG